MAVKKITKKNVGAKSKTKVEKIPNPITEDKRGVSVKKRPEDDKNMYVIAIILLTISMLLLGAIISYFGTWQKDQSLNSFSQLAELSPHKVENAMGKLGAITANILVGQLFGVFALCIPLMVVSFSFILFRVNLLFYRKVMVSLIPLTLIGATAAAYMFPTEGIFGSSLGGEWGYTMYIWLVNIIGDSGAGFVIFATFAIWLVLTSLTIVKYLGNSFSNFVTVVANIFKYIASFFTLTAKSAKRSSERIEKIKREDYEARVMAENIDIYRSFTPASDQDNRAEEEREEEKYINEYREEAEYGDEYREETEGLNRLYSNNNTDSTIDKGKYAKIEHSNSLNTQSSSIDDDLAVFEMKDIDPISTDEQEEKAVHQMLAQYQKVNTYKDNDDYSQDIDLDNVIIFKSLDEETPIDVHNSSDLDASLSSDLDISISHDAQPTDDNEEYNSGNVEPLAVTKRPTPADNVELDFEINTPQNESDNQDSGSFEISTPQNKSDNKDSDSFEITGGYTASEDIKDDFEVSVTSNAELKTDNIPDNENITITTNYNDESEDIDTTVYDPTKELSSYKLPPVDLLVNRTNKVVVTEEELYENKNRIVETLSNFNISIDKIKATIGPTVTLYEIKPAAGVRISKIKNLEDDIALSLSALGIRIIAPIPGKGTIGIEVPNKNKEVVSMYSVIKSAKFNDSKYDLPIVLGRTIQNEDFVIDLAKMPHLLVAGATGQGKSVGLNAIITSLLYKKHPAELKLVLIDPKKVELTLYSSIEKHFLAKMGDEDEAIITDTQKVIYTLNSLCIEMDTRYDLLKIAKVRNIKEYNVKFTNRRLNPNKGHRFMPYFVVIIDEFADLIMTAGREIEVPIARIAQLARAVGIHLVIATQRPTTNIITGVIKANFPARIAFRVSSMIDSRTILDQPGANQLIGCGDMLVSTGNEVTRVQCAFVDTPEVERITDYIQEQKGYPCAYELPEFVPEADTKKGNSISGHNGKIDEKFTEVARYVVQNQQGSASTIQRNFSIGFNRAGRLMDQLEKAGIVSRQEGSKPRKVLISDMASLEMILIDMEN